MPGGTPKARTKSLSVACSWAPADSSWRQFSITDMFWNPGYVIFLGLGAQLIRYEFAKRREITATAAPEGTQLRSEIATGAG